MIEVKFKKLDKNIESLPKYETNGSAGLDLRANLKENVVIKKGEIKLIKTGLAIALPNGYEAQIRSRSGLALKNGIIILNSPGTIDSDYRGEIGLILANFGTEDFVVENGMRMGQMVISKFEQAKVVEVEDLDDTSRDNGGFGSTGL